MHAKFPGYPNKGFFASLGKKIIWKNILKMPKQVYPTVSVTFQYDSYLN